MSVNRDYFSWWYWLWRSCTKGWGHGILVSSCQVETNITKKKLKKYLNTVFCEIFSQVKKIWEKLMWKLNIHIEGLAIWLNTCMAKRVPISLVTWSHKWHFELKTQSHGEFFKLINHIVLGDDPKIKQGKPSPDVFLACRRHQQLPCGLTCWICEP